MITAAELYEIVEALSIAADEIEQTTLQRKWLVERLDELADLAAFLARELDEREEERRARKVEVVPCGATMQ